ncbi:MAG: DHH family phosphoesterase [Polyangiales bacterium]
MNYAEVAEFLRRGRRYLLVPHQRPDADALGSALGLAAVLHALGKETVVFVSDPLPQSLRFLPGADAVCASIPAQTRFDATITLDAASAVLLPAGLPDKSQAGPLLVVDHHAVHDDFGDIVLRDLNACATGEVVYRLAEHLGMNPVPEAAASALYAAYVGDTGGFRYPGTSGDVLRQAATLLDRGADAWEVAYNLFEGWDIARLRLLSAVLDGLEVDLEGQLALLRVSQATLADTGAEEEMIEGLVNYGRGVRGVEVAVLVWERRPASLPPGKQGPHTQVSLRSRGRIDVARIAQTVGGGGHRGAAGALVAGSLDAVLARVRQAAVAALRPVAAAPTIAS